VKQQSNLDIHQVSNVNGEPCSGFFAEVGFAEEKRKERLIPITRKNREPGISRQSLP
jgi:hypothetical protein